MNTKIFTILILTICLITSCSEDDGSNKKEMTGDHVWKDQVDTMDKARAVEGMLEDAAQEQRQAIEENVQ